MIKKFCRCGKIIPKIDGLCEECKKKRYSLNKSTRKDLEINKFYSSVKWFKARNSARKRDKYICLYCYNIHQELTEVQLVHHIIPLKEDDTLKYEKSNLISLCRECHDLIHKEYEINNLRKEQMQDILFDLLGNS